jgi:hypothetical protein
MERDTQVEHVGDIGALDVCKEDEGAFGGIPECGAQEFVFVVDCQDWFVEVDFFGLGRVVSVICLAQNRGMRAALDTVMLRGGGVLWCGRGHGDG